MCGGASSNGQRTMTPMWQRRNTLLASSLLLRQPLSCLPKMIELARQQARRDETAVICEAMHEYTATELQWSSQSDPSRSHVALILHQPHPLPGLQRTYTLSGQRIDLYVHHYPTFLQHRPAPDNPLHRCLQSTQKRCVRTHKKQGRHTVQTPSSSAYSRLIELPPHAAIGIGIDMGFDGCRAP